MLPLSSAERVRARELVGGCEVLANKIVEPNQTKFVRTSAGELPVQIGCVRHEKERVLEENKF